MSGPCTWRLWPLARSLASTVVLTRDAVQEAPLHLTVTGAAGWCGGSATAWTFSPQASTPDVLVPDLPDVSETIPVGMELGEEVFLGSTQWGYVLFVPCRRSCP